ncbi:hypothetical protein [Candidatus Phytoplasma fraxini]|uniref:Preprotein translocase subunit SecE n=1 Tax=Ash yellows phytoplasma TaxID=35780 RepID=A0ABZ2U959_ASHYP
MLLKTTPEKEKINPLLDIIRKEYRLKNIFFVICSVFVFGLVRTLCSNQVIKEPKILYGLNIFCYFIFIIGIYPFFKKIIKEVGFIIYPSFKEIINQIIKVVLFVIVLIFTIYFFKVLYSKINPLKFDIVHKV